IMGTSSSSNTSALSLCFQKNNPPFNYTLPIASQHFSTVFTTLGLASNLFAFVVLVKSYQRTQSRSRSSFLIFLGSLVVTDFLGLLVTGSIVISFHTTHFNWKELDPDCHFCNFMGISMVFYGLCPLLLGGTMAIERFMGINQPFSRPTNMSKRRAMSTVLVVWVFAGCIGLLPVLGLGSYHMQIPGSWCFFSITSEPWDLTFCLIFSMVGLLSLAVSFVLNTVSVVTLFRVCCNRESVQRRRDHEVEMMVQLICIMIIASVCWCPLLVFIAQKVLSNTPLNISRLLLWIRFATWNQILDPWVYILFRRAVLRRVYPKLNRSRASIMTLYPSFTTTLTKLTRTSVDN
uniref:Thromboxane A2 receptor n=2 Tax=Lepisosteus oculatus TaxID=7918 RepID=W5LVP1_LEPOC